MKGNAEKIMVEGTNEDSHKIEDFRMILIKNKTMLIKNDNN